MDEISVSVVCNAYNHEKYIEDALKGFVMQKTNFAFEVLIHDDASTDNTKKIIEKYVAKYPDIIKPIYQKENQYSKGIPIGITFQYPRAKGKYIALCEGDDYWTDPLKLQKQYDILEAHDEVDVCAHCVERISADENKSLGFLNPSKTDCVFSVDAVIQGGGGFVGTNSLMFRSSCTKEFPKFLKNYNLDYFLQIALSLRGGMIYIAQNMSAYRVNVNGSWTQKTFDDTDKIIRHYNRLKTSLVMLDEYTLHKYKDTIEHEILKLDFKLFQCEEKYKNMLEPQYHDLYKKLSLKEKIKVRFPFLIKIKRKIGSN